MLINPRLTWNVDSERREKGKPLKLVKIFTYGFLICCTVEDCVLSYTRAVSLLRGSNAVSGVGLLHFGLGSNGDLVMAGLRWTLTVSWYFKIYYENAPALTHLPLPASNSNHAQQICLCNLDLVIFQPLEWKQTDTQTHTHTHRRDREHYLFRQSGR